ncbi:MAG: hypothetical protein D6711_03370 [Chloroflexi bacterium]|nr:MAG: hypothetical protein D6711_03370 [Chloroflexota bacterium]
MSIVNSVKTNILNQKGVDIKELQAGDSFRIHHQGCPSGEDTRRRLYIKVEAGLGNSAIVLYNCFNCGQGGGIPIRATYNKRKNRKKDNRENELTFSTVDEVLKNLKPIAEMDPICLTDSEYLPTALAEYIDYNYSIKRTDMAIDIKTLVEYGVFYSLKHNRLAIPHLTNVFISLTGSKKASYFPMPYLVLNAYVDYSNDRYVYNNSTSSIDVLVRYPYKNESVPPLMNELQTKLETIFNWDVPNGLHLFTKPRFVESVADHTITGLVFTVPYAVSLKRLPGSGEQIKYYKTNLLKDKDSSPPDFYRNAIDSDNLTDKCSMEQIMLHTLPRPPYEPSTLVIVEDELSAIACRNAGFSTYTVGSSNIGERELFNLVAMRRYNTYVVWLDNDNMTVKRNAKKAYEILKLATVVQHKKDIKRIKWVNDRTDPKHYSISDIMGTVYRDYEE